MATFLLTETLVSGKKTKKTAKCQTMRHAGLLNGANLNTTEKYCQPEPDLQSHCSSCVGVAIVNLTSRNNQPCHVTERMDYQSVIRLRDDYTFGGGGPLHLICRCRGPGKQCNNRNGAPRGRPRQRSDVPNVVRGHSGMGTVVKVKKAWTEDPGSRGIGNRESGIDRRGRELVGKAPRQREIFHVSKLMPAIEGWVVACASCHRSQTTHWVPDTNT